MDSPLQTAVGALIALVAVVMLALFTDTATATLSAVGTLIAGILFLAAGISGSIAVSGKTIEKRYLIAGGSALVAIAMLPTVSDPLSTAGGAGDLVFRATMFIGVLSLLALAVLHGTGRIETT